MVAQSCVMRAVPRLLTAAGLDLCWSYLIADIGRADFFCGGRRLLPRAVAEAGAVSEPEATAFAAELDRASAGGRFFGASNFRRVRAPVIDQQLGRKA